MKGSILLGGLVALSIPLSQAQAQGEGTMRVRVGLGAQTTPKYPGAEENQILPLFDLSMARNDDVFDFDAPDDSLGIDIINTNGFSFGPAVNFQSARKESDVGAPVGKVKATIEAGAFAEMMVGENFRLRGEVRKGLGGHDGIISSLGADYIARDRDNYVFSIGPRVLISDSKYQRAYFGVTPAVSLLTGLPVHDPDGGIHAIGATAGLHYSFNPSWGMFGYGRYERLVGDAKDSPIVEEFGSANQFSAGIGVTYTFSMRK